MGIERLKAVLDTNIYVAAYLARNPNSPTVELLKRWRKREEGREGDAMSIQANAMLSTVAEELHVSEDDLLKQGLRSFLERRLREVKAEIFEITGRYGVSRVEEMEARYREGTLEEAYSWRDLQRLDHLEYKRDHLLQLLETVA